MKNLAELKNNTRKITTNVWFKRSLYVLAVILLLISAFRIPYIGQFLDSTIFSFLFGYSKYILYLYLITILILKLFNCKVKAIFQKRFMLMILILTTLTSILLGGIEIFLYNGRSDLVEFYINNIWYDTLWNFNNFFVFGIQGFIDGGLIGTFFASISGIFIILFSLLLAVATYFYFFKAQWETIKVKTLKIFSKSEEKKSKTSSKIKNGDYVETLLNKEKLSKLNLNEVITNEINIENEVLLLSNFLTDNKISFTKIETSKTENHYCLTIKTNHEQLSKIYALKDSFKLIGLNNEYCLISTDEVIRIEYPLNKPVINFVLKKFFDIEVLAPLEFPLALSEDSAPVFFNLIKDSSFGVFDPKNHNINNFINVFIASLSAHYDKQNITIFYLNPLGDKKHFISTDLSHTEQILNISNIRNYFDKLKITIDNLTQKMKELEIDNIYKLNNKISEIYKNKIIIIDHINIIKNEDVELYKNIIQLLEMRNKCGITFMFIDHSNDGDSYDDIKYDTVLGFLMDQKLSKKLFDSTQASSLQKRNQAILCQLDEKNKQLNVMTKQKIIIPNISNSEVLSLESKFEKI